MKYMDDVQTVDDVIEWFRLYRGYTIRAAEFDYSPWPQYFIRLTTGLEDGPYNSTELCMQIWLAQWQRYAEKLRELLHVATGRPYDTSVWESCNDE